MLNKSALVVILTFNIFLANALPTKPVSQLNPKHEEVDNLLNGLNKGHTSSSQESSTSSKVTSSSSQTVSSGKNEQANQINFSELLKDPAFVKQLYEFLLQIQQTSKSSTSQINQDVSSKEALSSSQTVSSSQSSVQASKSNEVVNSANSGVDFKGLFNNPSFLNFLTSFFVQSHKEISQAPVQPVKEVTSNKIDTTQVTHVSVSQTNSASQSNQEILNSESQSSQHHASTNPPINGHSRPQVIEVDNSQNEVISENNQAASVVTVTNHNHVVNQVSSVAAVNNQNSEINQNHIVNNQNEEIVNNQATSVVNEKQESANQGSPIVVINEDNQNQVVNNKIQETTNQQITTVISVSNQSSGISQNKEDAVVSVNNGHQETSKDQVLENKNQEIVSNQVSSVDSVNTQNSNINKEDSSPVILVNDKNDRDSEDQIVVSGKPESLNNQVSSVVSISSQNSETIQTTAVNNQNNANVKPVDESQVSVNSKVDEKDSQVSFATNELPVAVSTVEKGNKNVEQGASTQKSSSQSILASQNTKANKIKFSELLKNSTFLEKLYEFLSRFQGSTNTQSGSSQIIQAASSGKSNFDFEGLLSNPSFLKLIPFVIMHREPTKNKVPAQPSDVAAIIKKAASQVSVTDPNSISQNSQGQVSDSQKEESGNQKVSSVVSVITKKAESSETQGANNQKQVHVQPIIGDRYGESDVSANQVIVPVGISENDVQTSQTNNLYGLSKESAVQGTSNLNSSPSVTLSEDLLKQLIQWAQVNSGSVSEGQVNSVTQVPIAPTPTTTPSIPGAFNVADSKSGSASSQVTDLQKQAYNEAEEKKMAQNAKYEFASLVNNEIAGNFQERAEIREGTKVYGKYSYDDSFQFRTVYYEADENGYRVIKEVVSKSKMTKNPEGVVDVRTLNNGHKLNYRITKKDIPEIYQQIKRNNGVRV